MIDTEYAIAQLVEQMVVTHQVEGSKPSRIAQDSNYYK